MVPLERGMELHGRTCRGDKLTDAEIAERDAWYAQMDEEEMNSLDLDFDPEPSEQELRERLRAEYAKIEQIAREIQEIQAANEVMIRRNEELRGLLAAKGSLAK